MLKISLLLLGLASSAICSGQKIEISSSGLFINSHRISNDTKPSHIQSILGLPDRKFLLHNTIWTFDDLGIKVYVTPATGELNSISLDFKTDSHDFSPTSTYSGETIIFGYHISAYTPLNSLRRIPELTFDKDSFISVYRATGSDVTLIFDYLGDITELNGVSISLD